jgi:hypothetical protein
MAYQKVEMEQMKAHKAQYELKLQSQGKLPIMSQSAAASL